MRAATNVADHVTVVPEYLTWEQAEAYTGFDERTLRRWVDDRAIAAYRVACSPSSTRLQTRLPSFLRLTTPTLPA